MSELTHGRSVMIYGQTEVVKDLIAARLQAGAPLLFECEDVTVEGLDHDEPVVRYRHEGAEHELRCDIVAGCDGFHGVCRPTIPEDALGVWGREYPYAWLGILADVAPSTDELIYAYSDRGFALHSMRSLTRSRLYIQVDPEEDIADWSDDRIWSELHQRLASDGWELNEGPDPGEGDHAHAQLRGRADALPIAAAGRRRRPHRPAHRRQGPEPGRRRRHRPRRRPRRPFTSGSDAGLDEYSDRCLTRVWRAQHFSWFMTTMLHLDRTDDAYGRQLQRSQLRYVTTSTAAATSLSENYVGLTLEQTAPTAVMQ